MKKRLTKFALSATLGFALTFTFSCSSDDKNDSGSKGGWLTCQEFNSLIDRCEGIYKEDFDKVDKCVIEGGCNGTQQAECSSHYEAMGCNPDGSGGGGGSEPGTTP